MEARPCLPGLPSRLDFFKTVPVLYVESIKAYAGAAEISKSHEYVKNNAVEDINCRWRDPKFFAYATCRAGSNQSERVCRSSLLIIYISIN